MKDIKVDAALLWAGDQPARVRGYVNQYPSPLGSHINGFWQGVFRGLEVVDGGRGRFRRVNLPTFLEVLGDGLFAVVHVWMKEPNFVDCRQDKLDDLTARAAVRELVKAAVVDALQRDEVARREILSRVP